MGLFDRFTRKPNAAPKEPEPPELTLPCEARVERWVQIDGVGSLLTDGGIALRFGFTACRFPSMVAPRVGQRVIVNAVAPHPLGGLRATELVLHPDDLPPPEPEPTSEPEPEEARAVVRARAREEQLEQVAQLRATLPDEGDGHEARFLEAIADAPDAIEPFLVYSDFLQAKGDPRGELIALAAHAPRKAKRPKGVPGLPESEQAFSCTFRLGLIETARIAADDTVDEIVDVCSLFATLRRHPLARTLRALTVGMPDEPDGEAHYDEFFATIAAIGVWPTLERLTVGEFTQEELEISWAHYGFLEPAWPRLGRLRALSLRGGTFDLGAIDLPSLRRLEVITGGLSRENLADVRAARLPALESLELYFGDENYGCDCELEDVEFLMDGKLFPGLRHLGLVNAGFADDLPRLLASSGILPRLRSLSLGYGILGARGAEAILADAHAFAHLERLDLRESYIPEELVERLRGVCAEVDLRDQRDDGPDDRYVSISE